MERTDTQTANSMSEFHAIQTRRDYRGPEVLDSNRIGHSLVSARRSRSTMSETLNFYASSNVTTRLSRRTGSTVFVFLSD